MRSPPVSLPDGLRTILRHPVRRHRASWQSTQSRAVVFQIPEKKAAVYFDFLSTNLTPSSTDGKGRRLY